LPARGAGFLSFLLSGAMTTVVPAPVPVTRPALAAAMRAAWLTQGLNRGNVLLWTEEARQTRHQPSGYNPAHKLTARRSRG
jgi:hypothetical protein